MKTYAVLLRGINVGLKNRISMAELKKCIEKLGYTNVSTYINSGNVILQSDKSADAVKDEIEKALLKHFTHVTELIKVLVLNEKQLKAVITNKPKGFGDEPTKYHSDAIFLIDISMKEAMKVFSPKEGVDQVWQGKVVIYSARLSAKRTQSRLNKIIGTPAYKCMTIRNWNTTTKLLELIQKTKAM